MRALLEKAALVRDGNSELHEVALEALLEASFHSQE
jgi:hypothetical protein